MNFSDVDLLKIDEGLAKEGIPFHARPLHAARQLLGSEFAIGFNDERVNAITAAYERLVPEVKSTWPGMGTGLAASIDRVRKFTVGVAMGEPLVLIDEGLGFASPAEWVTWCRESRETQARSAFAFADMVDLVYGTDSAGCKSARAYWSLAAGQIKLVAEGLSQSGSVCSAVLQPICLSVELATKGSLLYLGVTESELKNKFRHNLTALASEVASRKPHRDDSMLLAAVEKFPDYVGGRYEQTALTRLQIVSLSLDAQFIAATSVRRLSSYDMAAQVEAAVGARSSFFRG
ncbi:hypothetical protein NY751_22210 [Xanthomonas campestris]|uniref:hypothetical protein n=1 Tax=Xanthomonas campestris TaxID=339 RepID=UPI0023583660|nr:hypothetical protein [Xanthomonas campestris]MDC8748702.1 hypothetical protein [Xanthomonas campestris]